MSRRDELQRGLERTRARIAAACATADRSPDEVTLTVVTKFHPSEDVRLLANLGVTDVGENRHQEASAKFDACRGLPVRWHFIGQLQTNKAAAVARYADIVESVDSLRLADALGAGAERHGRILDCLIQVDLDPSAQGRGGVEIGGVDELAARIVGDPHLRLRGVMAVAPLGVDPSGPFEVLAGVARAVRQIAPDATWISAGMTGDLEQAILAGATHVRVGSAILGSRPLLR
jgi:hypothetical protein